MKECEKWVVNNTWCVVHVVHLARDLGHVPLVEDARVGVPVHDRHDIVCRDGVCERLPHQTQATRSAMDLHTAWPRPQDISCAWQRHRRGSP